jgi:hypothetical protein
MTNRHAEGFASIPRWILYDEQLSANAKLVYVVLSSHVGANDTAWPSHQRIADLLGVSKTTVKKMLAELKLRGLVSWTRRADPAGGLDTNAYSLTVDTPGGVGQNPTQVGREATGGRASGDGGWGVRRPGKRVTERESLKDSTPNGVETGAEKQKNATRIPDDWKPSPEQVQWAVGENGWPVEWCRKVTEDFVDYWRSIGGAKARRLDWNLTWKRWMRKEAENQKDGHGRATRKAKGWMDLNMDDDGPEAIGR